MHDTPNPDTAVDELAKVAPRAFTRARGALAAKLAQAGDKAGAARVRKLRAPPVSVWVVNRLAREHGNLVTQLLSATERVRAAQLGRPGAGGLGGASAEHAEALRALLARADHLLADAGIRPTHTTRQRVQTTLTAAADPEQRDALREGTLEHELAAQGFDVFEGAQLAPARSTSLRASAARAEPHERPPAPSETEQAAAGLEPAKPAAAERREAQAIERRDALARAEAERAAQRAEAARHIAELERAASEATRALQQARDEAHRATETLRLAEHAKRAADRELEAAKRRQP